MQNYGAKLKTLGFTWWLFAFSFTLLASAPALANTVSGNINYENRTYNSSIGFTGTNTLPVRYADVEVVVSATSYWGGTDASGNYSISVPSGGVQSVYVRVYARRNDANYNVIVKDNTTSNAIYTVATSPANLDTISPQVINVPITIAGGAAGSFNIFDCGIRSWQFMASLQSPMPGTLPQMTFYWQAGGTVGTYFSPSLNAIFLVGGASDPDEFDDDVILHEVGHFMARNFSKDDSPGGAHSITGQYDPRLTWSEGWATFWSCRTRNYAGGILYPEPSAYVDNFGTGFGTFEVEVPSFAGSAIMATNELAVSAVLWDIADSTPLEGADPTLAEGDSPIWVVFYGSTGDLQGASQVTLEDFFKGWRTRNPALVAATQTLFNTRSIKYFDDGQANDSALAATSLTGTTTGNTFYDVGDVDWFKFTVGVSDTVTVETLNLGDGCDTFMDLIDTDGVTVLASNDDRSGTDNSSIIQRTFTAAGTYYARIKSFDGAGRITEFGYYSIRLTISPNVAPSLSISASATSGTAPLRVAFTMTASDSDGYIASYEWDFNGDGKYDYFSTQSGSTTYTYSGGGTFSATAKVVDNAGGVKLQSTVITVTQPSSSATVTANATVSGPTAPVTADFSATISSLTPASYQWDFDGDGIIDYASITTATTQHIYRSAGSFIPMLIVTDANGVSYTAFTQLITVGSPASPPTVTVSASVANGLIPLTATLNAIATGAVSKYSWDFEGDGIIDQETTSASVTYTYTKVGTLYYTVYVTTSGNLSASNSGIIRSELSVPSGYIVTPRSGDLVSGSSLSIVAEVLPYGVSKTVQFQYRVDSPPGSWTNIGSPITSTGTIFTVTWDVSSFSDTDVYDVRALINSSISTGDNLNTVTIDSTSPDVNEYIDGLGRRVKEEIVRLDKTTRIVTGENAEFIFPVGSSSSAPTLRVINLGSNTHPLNGAATGLTAANRNYELTMISGASTFYNNFSIRIPFSGLSGFDASTLRILWWDTVSSTWKRDYQSIVSNSDGYVEVKASHMTEFGLFGSLATVGGGGGGGGGGGCFVATAVYGNPNASDILSLIRFRDFYISTTAIGRTAITTYNIVGPTVANTIERNYVMKRIAKIMLYPLVMVAEISQLSMWSKVIFLLIFINLIIAIAIKRVRANISRC